MKRKLRVAVLVVASTTVVAHTTIALPAAFGGSGCGIRSGPPATFAHVIWIWMENHSYRQVIASGSSPYINSLARDCGLATNYTAVAHPSLPN